MAGETSTCDDAGNRRGDRSAHDKDACAVDHRYGNEEREHRNGKREERNVPEMRRGGKEEGEEETETGNERRAGDRVRTGVCEMSELWTWFFPLSMRSWNYWQGN